MGLARSLHGETEDLVDRELAALRQTVEQRLGVEEAERRARVNREPSALARGLAALGRRASSWFAISASRLTRAFVRSPRRAQRFARARRTDLAIYGLCIVAAIVMGWLVGRV
jgi:hypothetical protein